MSNAPVEPPPDRQLTLAEVADLAASLPDVHESTRYGRATWFVGEAGFVWERPLSKADVRRMAGAPVPGGPIIALRTESLDEKAAVLAEGHAGVFTIEHFDGYPALLMQLDVCPHETVRQLIVDAWLAIASPDVAAAFLAQ